MVIIPLTFVIANCKFIQFPSPAFVSIATISELAARKSVRKMEVKPRQNQWNRKQNPTQLCTPGFICVLHTFGRDLK